jgi:hypothetical protein
MGWIVMARDECGDETRVSDSEWSSEGEALVEAAALRDRHPEYRRWWVETLRDKDYYLAMYDPDREEW